MDRNLQLEIRRRSAAMATPGASLAVSREELLEDLDELLTLRRARRVDAALTNHPSAGPRTR